MWPKGSQGSRARVATTRKDSGRPGKKKRTQSEQKQRRECRNGLEIGGKRTKKEGRDLERV